ncbi:unnamed protein product [Blepharisma stoltei]|uniref:Uncharacterized protein n=1 Tax=Blepharisma stoltei TaxID=1481888 RepID=A0AAU9JZY7_9CILI|nr:unnamed protein product [Blepharisma stoltei]
MEPRIGEKLPCRIKSMLNGQSELLSSLKLGATPWVSDFHFGKESIRNSTILSVQWWAILLTLSIVVKDPSDYRLVSAGLYLAEAIFAILWNHTREQLRKP